MAEYEKALLDADTPVLRAALSVQNNFVLVTHKESGKTVRYDNQTSFWGHWKNKAGGKLKEYNDIRKNKGLEIWTPDDFVLEECSELNPEVDNHIEKAVEQFDYFVGRIKRYGFADDYVLGIGGEGNFRKDIAQILPYKGLRKDKPLLFQEVKEAIVQKYKNKVVISNNQEVDDWAGIEGFKNYKHFLKTGKWKNVLGFCDKDLAQIISPQFNYLDDNAKVFIPTPEDAARAFTVQLLCGDKGTDNIQGLPNFTDEIRQKYSLGKTKGIGRATALKYLESSENIAEMFFRCLEAYKSYYGVERKPFVSWRGEEHAWNYMDYLQDNAQLLWLRREEGEEYKIVDTLNRLGIEYD